MRIFRASLDTLPVELLHNILEYCGGVQDHLPRKFRVSYALSHVCHRLRDFSLPYLYRNLQFDTHEPYVDYIKGYYATGGDYRASYVRSISIGIGMENVTSNPLTILHGSQPCPFLNLRSFEFNCGIPERHIVYTFSHCPRLETLILAWSDQWRFPDVTKLASLRTLRLMITRSEEATPDFSCTKIPDHTVHHNLTTLHMEFFDDADWHDNFWLKLKFPNLRVLNLQGTSSSSRSVYDFIQCHPTLLEVNVSFCDEIRLRLEGLIKLINGTGTWKSDAPYYSEQEVRRWIWDIDPVSGKKVKRWLDDPEVPTVSERNRVVPLLSVQFPDEIPGTHITFGDFAFTRVPLTPEATQWSSREGSKEPRYRATALSLHILDQFPWEFAGMTFAYLEDFFLLSPLFPGLEELRLASDMCYGEEIPRPYEGFMRLLAERLANWTSLRKLSISWITNNSAWYWETTMHPPALFPDWYHVPWYEDVAPPTERWFGYPRSLNNLKGVENLWESVEDIEDSLAQFMREGEELDPDDPSLFTRIWQSLHEPQVAKMMRHLAEKCPTLEQIDWLPMAMVSQYDSATLWRWKIIRQTSPEGKRKVKRVVGDLTWRGGLAGKPDLTDLILAGQEAKHYRSTLKYRW